MRLARILQPAAGTPNGGGAGVRRGSRRALCRESNALRRIGL